MWIQFTNIFPSHVYFLAKKVIHIVYTLLIKKYEIKFTYSTSYISERSYNIAKVPMGSSWACTENVSAKMPHTIAKCS